MGLAILKTRQIATWLKYESGSYQAPSTRMSQQGLQSWKVLSALMTFFLFGYSLAACLVFYNQANSLVLLTGVVFFLGAIFVLFSVSVYAVTLRQLIASQTSLREESNRLTQALEKLRQVQHNQMLTIHTEKMHSLGQMSAGIAHEINNPIGFIYSNLDHVQQYANDLFTLIDAYERQANQSNVEKIDTAKLAAEIDLSFIRSDLFRTIQSMRVGSDRIKSIVNAMRNFSRLDESKWKSANITEGIESTLVILQGKLNDSSSIKTVVTYDPHLTPIYCDHSAINQTLLHILSNAIEALTLQATDFQTTPTIAIVVQQLDNHWIQIAISDNGNGIRDEDINHIFDPFFTTKPIGKGTGLGLSISHQIVVEQHNGQLVCSSQPGKETTFTIRLPIGKNSGKT